MNKVVIEVATIPNMRQRILVMDDNKDMLKLLDRTLFLEGYDTIIVADPEEALSIINKVNPDMVIMDTFTTRGDSLQALDALRKSSNAPIIVMTTDVEPEDMKNVLAHGADDFIHKPFSVSLLLARIRAKLRRYQSPISKSTSMNDIIP